MPGDPRGDGAVGRDQRGGLARRFQYLAHGERNRQRFLCRGRAIDQGDTGRVAFGAFDMLPLRRVLGWSEQLADQRGAAGGAVDGAGCRPWFDLAAGYPDSVEQQLEVEMRMPFAPNLVKVFSL